MDLKSTKIDFKYVEKDEGKFVIFFDPDIIKLFL